MNAPQELIPARGTRNGLQKQHIGREFHAEFCLEPNTIKRRLINILVFVVLAASGVLVIAPLPPTYFAYQSGREISAGTTNICKK